MMTPRYVITQRKVYDLLKEDHAAEFEEDGTQVLAMMNSLDVLQGSFAMSDVREKLTVITNDQCWTMCIVKNKMKDTLFKGTIIECEAFIRLYEQGYIT